MKTILITNTSDKGKVAHLFYNGNKELNYSTPIKVNENILFKLIKGESTYEELLSTIKKNGINIKKIILKSSIPIEKNYLLCSLSYNKLGQSVLHPMRLNDWNKINENEFSIEFAEQEFFVSHTDNNSNDNYYGGDGGCIIISLPAKTEIEFSY